VQKERGPGGPAPRRGPGAPKKGGAGGGKQPDPMQTSVGYIGADAFLRKGGRGGGKGGRRGGR
jgi:23S rRNA pseudouridine2605 synthase